MRTDTNIKFEKRYHIALQRHLRQQTHGRLPVRSAGLPGRAAVTPGLNIVSAPGEGTTVRAQIPFRCNQGGTDS